MAATHDHSEEMSFDDEFSDFLPCGELNGDENDEGQRGTHTNANDFHTDDCQIDDGQTESFHSDDFQTENFQSEDFSSALGSEMADNRQGRLVDEAPRATYPTYVDSNGPGEAQPARFFHTHQFEETTPYVSAGMDARGTSMVAYAYTGSTPSTHATLPGSGTDSLAGLRYSDATSSWLPVTHERSGGAAQSAMWTDTAYTNRTSLMNAYHHADLPQQGLYNSRHRDEEEIHSTLDDFIPLPASNAYDRTAYDRTYEQPWNPFSTLTRREGALPIRTHWRDQRSHSNVNLASAPIASGSGMSSGSINLGSGTSNTSEDYNPEMADSTATILAPGFGGQRSSSRSGFENVEPASWPWLQQRRGAGSASAQRHAGQRMRGAPRTRSHQSETLDQDVNHFRRDARPSGSGGQHPSAEDEDLACPEDGCEARFHGSHKRGSLHRHLRMKHSTRCDQGTVTLPCGVPGCPKIFMRMDSRLKHHRKHHVDLNIPAAVPRK